MKFLLKLTTLCTAAAILLCPMAHANAKISWGPDKNKILVDGQVTQIKGFLYDAWDSNEHPAARKHAGPEFAKAIIWLDKIHAQKKVHDVLKIKSSEAEFVREAVFFIMDFVNGRAHNGVVMPPHVIKAVLARWTQIGRRTVAVYKKERNKVEWKLYLKEAKPEKTTGKEKNEKKD